MREIILDTETTGLDPAKGHRIIEIGCVELLNAIPTGETFHVLWIPNATSRGKLPGAWAFGEFLAGKPLFAKIAGDFLTFAGDAKIIAHNAEFDFAVFSMRN